MIGTSTRKLRVALFGRYPDDPEQPRGGVESVTVVLARALASLGDLDVHVLTLEKCNGLAVETCGSLTVHRLPASRWPQILDILAGPGRRRLISYVRRLRADVLHTHEVHGLVLKGILVPHVFTLHGFDYEELRVREGFRCQVRARVWRRILHRGLRHQKHIVAISRYAAGKIDGLTKARIHYIENPVAEEFFEVERRPEPGRVLCGGWICERKNTLAAVRAVGQIVREGVSAVLVLAGSPKPPEYLDRVKAAIAECGLEGKVEILGHVGHARLRAELARAAVFLLPSLQETAPMAIAEAMSAGVPAVTSNRCGMPYMVADGESGFVTDAQDTGRIAACLKQVLADGALCARMGERARAIARERFRPASVARRTREMYVEMRAEGLARNDVPAGRRTPYR